MSQKHEDNTTKLSVEDNLTKDYVPKSKRPDLPLNNSSIDDPLKKENEKLRKDLDKFKDEVLKKFKFVQALGIVPDQANKLVEEEFEISKDDAARNLLHVVTIIPEENFKDIAQIRIDMINAARKINDKFWVHVLTPVDLWNLGLDSKFEVFEALSMCYPLFDTGLLGALRVTQIHKSLVLKKFDKYVTSYVIAGSLVRGEATETSDVDVFLVIDDTDVKRMPRLELKEKLRSIVQTYIGEAQAIAGVKNILNVQSYLLTDFWEAVKDAHPVMFTFIRDGIALYDRGAFLPWKSLLRMGKIKPSPEAIDMFMSSGNKLKEMIDRRLLDIAVIDIYWSILTPTQGILMLYGLAPPTPKETMKLVREIFFEKEKMLEEKYVKIIEEIITYYKSYEHGKVKSITGTELDKMSKNALDYFDRLKKLREEIQKRNREKSIDETYADVFALVGNVVKKNNESSILKSFDEEFIKTGRFAPRVLENLKFIARTKVKANEKLKVKSSKPKKDDKKTDKQKEISLKISQDVEVARRYASEITTLLVEYAQRKELAKATKARFIVKGRDMTTEIFFLNDVFLVHDGKLKKISHEKLVDASTDDLTKQIAALKDAETKIDMKALEVLRKIFGEFELIH